MHLEEITLDNRLAVSRLTVSRGQLAFVSPVEDMLAGAESRHGYSPYTMVVGRTPVGFLILIVDPAAMRHYSCSEKPLGLEGFFVDAERQGRGYGSEAVSALATFVRKTFPDRQTLDLTVNCRNAGAIRTYLKGGFEDTGRLYHGGRSGPQHVFSMPLDSDHDPGDAPRQD